MAAYIPALTLPHQVFSSQAVSILTPVVLGSAVGISIGNDKTKKNYLALRQPPLSPPTWIFGPMWTAIYGLMGYTAHRTFVLGNSVLSPPETLSITRQGATLYSIQLAMNLLWTPLFFGFKKPVAATVDIVALLGVNVYLTYLWYSVDKVAGYCQIPHLAWLSFATYLCVGIGSVNGWTLDAKEVSKKE